MTERTQLNQPDEALRQTRLTDQLRTGLREMADKLNHNKPGHLMTASQRLAIALTTADATYPNDEDAAVEFERQLLQRMPFVESKAVTRGEYALWLHKTSWSA